MALFLSLRLFKPLTGVINGRVHGRWLSNSHHRGHSSRYRGLCRSEPAGASNHFQVCFRSPSAASLACWAAPSASTLALSAAFVLSAAARRCAVATPALAFSTDEQQAQDGAGTLAPLAG